MVPFWLIGSVLGGGLWLAKKEHDKKAAVQPVVTGPLQFTNGTRYVITFRVVQGPPSPAGNPTTPDGILIDDELVSTILSNSGMVPMSKPVLLPTTDKVTYSAAVQYMGVTTPTPPTPGYTLTSAAAT